MKRRKEDDQANAEAEAAAALLTVFSLPSEAVRLTHVDVTFIADDERLWDTAIEVIKRLTKKEWIESWNSPKEKDTQLRQLLSDRGLSGGELRRRRKPSDG